MKSKKNKSNEKKRQFSSYYCEICQQKKPCQLLMGWNNEQKNWCCACYYQSEQEKAQEYSTYQKVLINKQKEHKKHLKQLLSLKNYANCSACSSQKVDAYELYENNKLVCWKCLISQGNSNSSPVSFSEQQKWYQKQWKIDISQWLAKYRCLPINANCVKRWNADNKHLSHCNCLEQESQELYSLFANFLKEMEQKLISCVCETSKKVRVSNDYYTNCEICAKILTVASKKRVIKNRNDPRFWGLTSKEKILCGDCLEQKKETMPPLRKAEFNRYRKRGKL